VRSKAGRNQLNLPHGTETKPEMLNKTVSSQGPLCQSGRKREDLWWEGTEGFVKEVGFERFLLHDVLSITFHFSNEYRPRPVFELTVHLAM